MKSILVVDDDSEFTDVLSNILDHLGHHASIADSVAEAKEWLRFNTFDHIFVDFMLPDGSGLHVYELIQDKAKNQRITFITGNPEVKKTISELLGPKVDFLMKPIQREDLEQVLSRVLPNTSDSDEVECDPAVDHKNSTEEKNKASTSRKLSSSQKVKPKNTQSTSASKQSSTTLHFGCLIGESPEMKNLYKMIERVAKSHANVMLLGESGSGKELVAQAIHNASDCEGDLVTTNCGGLSKELIGSELFGHEKGAFTGAISQKIGVFERAHQGSLFLDEVTEMPIDMQPNLLRVLETKKVVRVGGTTEFPIECRVISATNRSLENIAEENVMREDIYFRLAVFPIEIPPLRKRKKDISILAAYFVDDLNQQHQQAYQLTAKQITQLESYDWPGNVRELRHAIHRAFIMSEPDTKTLTFPDTFESPFAKASAPKQTEIAPGKTIESVEKALIFATLKDVDGNKSMAAEMLGISTKTLYNRLHAYGEID